VRQLLVQAACGMRLGEARHQGWRGDEQHAVATQDGLAPEGDGQVGLADTGWPQEQQILAVGHPAAGRQFADLPFIHAGLGRVVEAGQRGDAGEVRNARAHLDTPFVLAGNLALAQESQGLPERQLLTGGFVEQAVQLIADGRQVQPRQHVHQVFVGDHQKLPPATAS